MKLSNVLMMAGAGVAVGLLLTRTEKGKSFRRNVAHEADEWGKKISNLSSGVKQDLRQLAEKGAGKIKKGAESI